MNKGPTPRHSKSPKPVIIDLDATDVTPRHEDPKTKPSPTGPAVARTADEASYQDAGKASANATAKSDSSAKPASDPKGAPAAADAKAQEARPRQPEPAAASSKTSASTGKSGGGLGMAASGVIGAIIALGGFYALQAGGLLPAPGGSGDQVASLASRLDAVSAEVATLSQQVTDSAGRAGPDISAQLTARLDRLETGLAETTANAGGQAGDPAALIALEERIAGLESKIAETADPALAAELVEMRAAQTGLQASLTELQSLTDDISGKITALAEGQQTLEEQIDAPSRQIDLARAIAAAGLKSAIDRGGSFTTELEAFASVAPDDPALPELRDLAAQGIPSRSDLVAGFSDSAVKAIAAADPADPQVGLVDRLMSSALSVVKVRKVGEVPGDSAEAIVARTEARLVNGDLDAAVAEWTSLPEASRTATADFGDALAARARAEKLIAAVVAPSGAPATQAPAN